MITLEVDNLNFVDKPEDFQLVVDTIDRKLAEMKMDAI